MKLDKKKFSHKNKFSTKEQKVVADVGLAQQVDKNYYY